MKKNRSMRAIAWLFLAAALCGLTACANKPADAIQNTAAPALPIATVMTTECPTAEPSGGARTAMLDAYRAALLTLLREHTLPDGTDCGYDELADPAGNQFAILDVDCDGREELVVCYATTYMAGQTQGIFGFDESGGTLTAELIEYPLLTFYDNGAIAAGWSHNQGLAGSFWPYSLYAYDAATDRYALVGAAGAWEKAFAPQDWEGNPYPDDVDVSGAGFVYYITENGGAETAAPVDAAVYEAWRASTVGDASEVSIPYVALTEENIAALS